MSRAAQEMQRLADELKRNSRASKPAAGRRRADMINENQDGLGIEPEPEAVAPAVAPTEQPAQGEAAPAPSEAAPTAEEGADMAKAAAKRPAARTRGKSTAAAPAKKKAAPAAAPKKAAAPKAPAAPKAARPAKVPSDLTLKAEDPAGGTKTVFMRSTKQIFRQVFALALASGKLNESDAAAVTKLQGRLK